ncbi:response regulator [Oleiharenicola lentus]|uniref:response regulator n=1 Tax=Oleiharenicola lentus TaxID=2508720 RepID=UPI003F6639F1
MSAAHSAKSIRVLLIDDSPLIKLGLRSALEDYADIVIIGDAANAADGVRLAFQTNPDVVLLDFNLPDKSGVEVCRELRSQGTRTRILMLTSSSNERHVQNALQAGANGYLLKDNDGATLAKALRETAAGASVIDAALPPKSTITPTSGAAEKLARLSAQERRVVALLADGLTNKAIGLQMGLTEKTVKNYLAAIFTKLNIERRTQAVTLHLEASHED